MQPDQTKVSDRHARSYKLVGRRLGAGRVAFMAEPQPETIECKVDDGSGIQGQQLA
jgi:hypothetical protein